MVVIEGVHPMTSTMSVPVESVQWTNSRTTPTKTRREVPPTSWIRKRLRSQTAPEVDPAERGNEEERNRANSVEADQSRPAQEPKVSDDGKGSRARSELARDLVHRVDQLLPLVGDVSSATNLQLLKRDLSLCHDALKDYPAESNFLSIVTLIESAMTQLKWKQYTRPQLETLRQAFDIGYRQVRVEFEDYEKVRALFASKQVAVTPRIDLESLKWEEIADDDKD